MQRVKRVVEVFGGAVGVILVVALLLLASSGARAITQADLQVVGIAGSPNPVYVGNDLTYTVGVKNNGPEAGGEARLVVTVPNEVEFVSARPTTEAQGSENPACAPNGFDGEFATIEPNVITCQVNGLTAGQSRTVEIILAPVASGRKEASAKIEPLEDGEPVPDPTPTNNAGSALTEVKGYNCTSIGSPTIFGVSGDDSNLKGTAGDDVICGLSGNDTIAGLGGNDIIYGGRGNDVVDAGDGDDLIRGGPDDDQITGRAGTDTVSYEDALAGVTVNLTTGEAHDRNPDDRDALVANDIPLSGLENVVGSAFGDYMFGNAGPNLFSGSLDKDRVGDVLCQNLAPEPGGTPREYCRDVINGQEGVDTVSYAYSRYGVTLNLATGRTSFAGTPPPDDDDHVIGNTVENVRGSRLGDTLAGSGTNNTLVGDLGNDTLNVRDEVGGDAVAGGKGTKDRCLADPGDTKTGCP